MDSQKQPIVPANETPASTSSERSVPREVPEMLACISALTDSWGAFGGIVLLFWSFYRESSILMLNGPQVGVNLNS